MTCVEIRAQLAALLKERDQLAVEVEGDKGDLKELQSESTHVNPNLLAKAQARLAADEAKQNQLVDQIAALRNALETQGCFVKQPQHILEIQYANPDQVKDVDALAAQAIALGKSDPTIIVGGGFPSLDAQQEWKQVLPADLKDTAAHEEDYEGPNLVGATGWALQPEFSGGDVPFDHPFGFDWEFMLALDQPADDPKRYTFLLTPGDQSCDEDGFPEAVEQATAFTRHQLGHPDPIPDPVPIPRGPDDIPSLLGVEIDAGLVPTQFSDPDFGVLRGDRMAVFGRWIVDCGHQLPIKSCDGDDKHPGVLAFRTEIHPPLLMAAARVTTGSLLDPTALNAPELTRVVVTSRPYLVSQRFTVDTDKIYVDTAPDDGPFVPHLLKEVEKVNATIPIVGIPTESVQVEAHPKIKSYPFQGSYELRLTIRPPLPPTGIGSAAPPAALTVSFQFTVRSGCTVQIIPSGSDSIDVVIRLNQADYKPFPLPRRSERTWSKEELGKLNPDAASAFTGAEWISAGIQLLEGNPIGIGVVREILGKGIVTDEYDTSDIQGVNILDATHAISALANNIPGTDIQAQLAALVKERDQLAIEVEGDKGDLKELQSESTHVNPNLLAKAQARLAADEAKLKQVNDQIAALVNVVKRGVLQNDNQPYPVFGWLEVSYASPQVHS